jgi:hypothetical protein
VSAAAAARDIEPGEIGSASSSLRAVQQLAGSIGVAVILSVWFHRSAGNPAAGSATGLIVAALTAGCCFLVALLRREPQPEHAEPPLPTNAVLGEQA